MKGMQKEGLPGLWKGFQKGVGGAAFKPAAGIIYLPNLTNCLQTISDSFF